MEKTRVRNPPPVPVKAVWVLGFAGLVPMMVGAGSALFAGPAEWVDSARLYALAVLSFVGGTHWGLNVRHNRAPLLALSVLPALVGWTANLTLNQAAEAVALAIAFAATQLLDEYQTEDGYLHAQYRLLRRLLTGLAVVCLVAMAAAR